MSEYKKSETRRLLEEIISGRYPVRSADGREYYVRYNDSKEELEEVPPPELRPLTESQKAEAAELAAGLRPQGFGVLDIAKEGLKGFGQGVRLMRICSVRRKAPVWAMPPVRRALPPRLAEMCLVQAVRWSKVWEEPV